MDGRELFSEELLSAYLDGEVTGQERAIVQRWLADIPQARQRLAELESVQASLQRLPRHRLPDEVSGRIMARVHELAGTDRSVESAEFPEELLSAYLDGEVTEEERERVEAHLREHGEARELLAELQALTQSLDALPTYRLDGGFARRVVQRAQAEAEWTDARRPVVPRPAAVSERGGRRRRTLVSVWALLVVATALLAMYLVRGSRDEGGLDVVINPPPETPATVEAPVPAFVPDPSPQIADNEPAVAQPAPQDISPSQPPSTERRQDSMLTLVSGMVQNRRVQLVLVYEIDVTPEGDQSAAFARLLQRHQIRMFQAQPIGRGEQEQLIRQRFLKDVQFVDEKRDNMDDVDLFLVFCTGRVADDLYLDLMNRPSGFAGYRLNLTTREAQGGAWQKACLAAGENPPANSAYDLVASLGILSGVGRQLGAFGAIGWVEPSLLDPPPLDPAEAMQDGVPANGQAGGTAAGSRRVRHVPGAAAPSAELQPLQNGDFPCELLFVVRKLNPLPPPPAR